MAIVTHRDTSANPSARPRIPVPADHPLRPVGPFAGHGAVVYVPVDAIPEIDCEFCTGPLPERADMAVVYTDRFGRTRRKGACWRCRPIFVPWLAEEDNGDVVVHYVRATPTVQHANGRHLRLV